VPAKSKNMKIRFAEERDIEFVIRLCKAHALYEKSNFNENNKKEQLSKHLFESSSGLKCLVVESGIEIIGYATFFRQFSTWDADYYIYLDCLFLKENARGKGTGQQIMDVVKKYSKEAGYSIIQWQTPDFNTKAIKFYSRLGAERKAKERFFWQI
jgi:GNAT superfamily N-acetyltransferase